MSADASSYGLGACLLQEIEGDFKPIAYASRSLTEAEKRWAQIDKECLALVWACEKFSHYLVGLPTFRLITDHKPLVPLINTKDLDKTPIRVQRMLMRLLRFNCYAEHVPGKNLVIADTLSRHKSTNVAEPSSIESDVEQHVALIEAAWPVSDNKLKEIAIETTKCPELSLVMRYTSNGWPEYQSEIPNSVENYFASRHCLTTTNGVLTYLDRIVIPISLRQDVLHRLHSGHQGISKCRETAQQTVWWPTINRDIEGICKACAFCEEHRPSKRFEPMISTPLPSGAWRVLGIDLLEHDKVSYMVVVCYYSRFIELVHLPSTTSKAVISRLKNMFARHGIPFVVRTDGGPQFMSKEFSDFSTEYDFSHEVSSPYYPHGNASAEAAVKIAKQCLRQPDPSKALMMYRAAPITATGHSPAHLMYNRHIRTLVPNHPKNLEPNIPVDATVRARDNNYKRNMAANYNRHHGVRTQPEFDTGQTVRIKTDNESTWQPAIVQSKTTNPRSYQVVTHEGKLLRRNSKHIMASQTTGQMPKKSASESRALQVYLSQPPASTQTDTTTNTSKMKPKPDSSIPKTIKSRTSPEKITNAKPVQAEYPTQVATRSGRAIKMPKRLDL